MKRASRPARTPASLPESVYRQLNMYALAATAAGVGLALAPPAEAKIVYTKAHRVIHGPGVFNLDLNHDGIVDYEFDIIIGTEASWQALYIVGNSVWHTSKHGWEWASALPAGVRIGQTNHGRGNAFMLGWKGATTKLVSSGNWLDVKNQYLGLSFLIKGKTHYGWARLSASVLTGYRADSNVSAILTGYAYETIPGKAIITGKTKGADDFALEPDSIGALAAGASAVSASRGTDAASH